MLDCGVETDETIVFQYVDYLEDTGIFRFTGDLKNGYVGYMTDVRGNLLAQVIVTLSVGRRTDAMTKLHFRPFITATEED